LREITYREALNEALREEMTRDERVFLIGEDIGRNWGGAFKVTKGLAEEFGDERVRDTPISENTIIGVAVGSAMVGMRPVAEIMFGDLITLAMDQIVNQAAKIRYMFGGQLTSPVVVRTPFGTNSSIAAHHSQSLISWFTHVPGLEVVVPSSPYDVKGLLKAAIRSENPTMFFEHKQCYNIKGAVPQEEYTVPIGQADVKRRGEEVTVVAIHLMVHKALRAAEKLAGEGIEVEVIDLRALRPLDVKTLADSVAKTGRLVIVEEDCLTGGVGAEIASVMMDVAFDRLDAPIKRVATLDTPIPFSPPLENYIIPDEEQIAKAVRELVG